MRSILRNLTWPLVMIPLATNAPCAVNGAEPAATSAVQPTSNGAAAEAGRGNGTGGGRGTGMGGGRGKGGDGGGGGAAKAAAIAKLETIKGEIVKVDDGSTGPANGGRGRPGPMISLRTEKETLAVHAGAPHYRLENKLELKVGDMVEVTGTRSTKGQAMFVAYAISKGGQVLTLRDDQGNKLWKPRQRAQEPTRIEVKARVVSLESPGTHSPGSGLGRKSQFVFVRSDKEEIAIEVGPNEYRESHGLKLQVDDQIGIVGWKLPSAQTAGKPVVLVESITKDKTVVQLRDERRRPLWKK